MGGFSVWHWLVIITVLAGILAATWLAGWVIVRLTRRLSPVPSQAEFRLQELEVLKSKHLITHAEYERRRAEIINGV